MIQLKHIQQLDAKVRSALTLIDSLRVENTRLRGELDRYQSRIDEMESLIQDFRQEQGAIEEGILRALKQLDSLEDVITESGAEGKEVADAPPAGDDVAVDSEPSEASESGQPDEDAQSQPVLEPEISDQVGDSADETAKDSEKNTVEKDAAKDDSSAPTSGDTEGGDSSPSDDVESDDDAETDPPDTGESELDIF